jgi:hypothetical protein
MHSGMIVARADRSHKKVGVFDGYPRGAGQPEFDGVWPSKARTEFREFRTEIVDRAEKSPHSAHQILPAIKAQRALAHKILKVSLFNLFTGIVAS